MIEELVMIGGVGTAGVASMGSGAVAGYCKSQGIEISPEALEYSLLAGPTIIGAGGGAIVGAVVYGLCQAASVIGVNMLGAAFGSRSGFYLPEKSSKDTIDTAIASAKGAFAGGAVCAAATGIGYAIGYGIGTFRV